MSARISRVCLATALVAFAANAGQQATYRVKPVDPPELKRPAVQLSRERLPRGTAGSIPTYDGEPFHLNLTGAESQAGEEPARRTVQGIAAAFGWAKAADELRGATREAQRGADRAASDAQVRAAIEETKKRVSGKLGRLSAATLKAIEDRTNEARALVTRGQEVVSFDQRVQGVRVEHAGLQTIYMAGRGIVALRGSYYATVNLSNRNRVDEAGAMAAARAHVSRATKLAAEQPVRPELVVLPYGDSMKYAWRIDVVAEEGPYRLWIDAENRAVLRLEPLFAADSGTGLVFNPNPNVGTVEKSFDVNGPSSSTYRLALSGVVDANNAGADGVTSGDLTIASGGGSANFNVAPINGTVVERTNQANYNSRFQEVNAYGWVHDHIKSLVNLGSRNFPSVTVTVNHNNPCGFGVDNACGGSSAVTYGIGSATTSSSTAGGALFNAAIDATVVTHEFGHVINRLQLTGISVGALDEGMADFWAATIHNNDTFGAFWKHNGGSTPVQTGFVPRQAEPLDVFPEHRAFQREAHADGQIIDWALWSTRIGLNNQGALGTLVINTALVKALTTASSGLSGGSTDKGLHDAYLNLLQQLSTQITTSGANKLFSGFARAGITLAERDSIIDIDDDFLSRGSATGPTFTIFGGRDYQFAGQNANPGAFFNTRFQVEVANDAAFSVNHITGPVVTGIAVNAQGVPQASWTLPVADWNTVKGGNQLFYRVTTTDGAGGSPRISTSPGNGFTTVPVPSATINASGQCDCSYAPPSAGGISKIGWFTLIPLLIAWIWRRRLKRNEVAA